MTELVPASLPLKNERHEAFCYRYAECDNATEAYIAAGFAPGGARQSAHNLLKRPEIRARVEYIRQRVAAIMSEREHGISDRIIQNTAAKLTGITDRKTRVLEELELLGHSDVMNYTIDDNGWIEVKGDLPPHLSRAVESIEVTRRRIPGRDGEPDEFETKTKFKLWSKPTALKMLGDHERLFGEQPEGPRASDKPTQVFIIAGREIYL